MRPGRRVFVAIIGRQQAHVKAVGTILAIGYLPSAAPDGEHREPIGLQTTGIPANNA